MIFSASTRVRRDWASVPDRLSPPMPAGGVVGWIGPILVTVIAAIVRFVSLGRPHAVVFDETYYAKDALSLLRFGYEKSFIEDANDVILASDGNWRTLDVFGDAASYVVHPPVGKWVIAGGEYLFGATPFGWRFAVALLGTLSVLIIARTVRRMTRSNLIGTIAGLLLALDGIAIVMSRTAVLDMVLSFLILTAFALLVIDRDRTRRKLADLARTASPTSLATEWGPRLGIRPWRWAAAVSLGLACGVKWSALWFIAFFGLMTVLWDVGARRTIGVQRPWAATLIRDAPLAALSFIVIPLVVYLFGWTGWFLSDAAWDRNWALNKPDSVIPDALRSLWNYHVNAWNFHVGLSTPHSYQSNPLSWLVQSRPTSFYWEGDLGGCGADRCVSSVLAVGNPIIWWAGIVALIHQLWRWAACRDWRSGAVLVGVAAGWVPWMLYLDRTVFTFYTVVFVPFIAAALAMSLGEVIGLKDAPSRRRITGAVVAGGVLLAVVVVAWWMYPVWTGEVIPYDMWRLRMWMPTWV